MTLMSFFQWLESFGFNKYLHESDYMSPINNLLHLLSLVVFAGALVVVDLRLLGHGLTKEPVAQVARAARPWLIGGFLGLLVTGFFALTATAMMQYYNSTFWLKMYFLLAALVVTFIVRPLVIRSSEARMGHWAKVVGLVSMVLWAAVAISARLIMLL
jgi:Family of unknown function (DUF6644)